MSSAKILVVLSSAHKLRLQNGKEIPTGFFMNEMIVPLQQMNRQGWKFTFANPLGNSPSQDPFSDRMMWFGFNWKTYNEAKKYLSELFSQKEVGSLSSPKPFSSISETELGSFGAMFVPGGHAPLVDLANDAHLGKIIHQFYQANKPIGAISHGPAALLSTVSTPVGIWPFADYHMTCYSNLEESMTEFIMRGKVPFRVKDKLRGQESILHEKLPMVPNVVEDRELVTGQGPASAWRFGQRFILAVKNSQAGFIPAAPYVMAHSSHSPDADDDEMEPPYH